MLNRLLLILCSTAWSTRDGGATGVVPEADVTPVTLSVRVADSVPVAILDARQVVEDLRLRLRGTGVSVELWTAEQAATWAIELSAEHRRVRVCATSLEGGSLIDRVFAAPSNRPREVARTIALLIVEALSRVLPHLVEAMPEGSEGQKEQRTDVPLAEPRERLVRQMPPQRPASRLRWHVRGSAHVGIQLPRPRAITGGGAAVQLDYAGWHAALSGSAWSSVEWRTDDLHLTMRQATFDLTGGVTHVFESTRAYLALGPALRWVTAEADGTGTSIGRQDRFDVGVAAVGRGAVELAAVEVGLTARATFYSSRDRFLVDGHRVLVSGHTLLLVALDLGFGS